MKLSESNGRIGGIDHVFDLLPGMEPGHYDVVATSVQLVYTHNRDGDDVYTAVITYKLERDSE